MKQRTIASPLAIAGCALLLAGCAFTLPPPISSAEPPPTSAVIAVVPTIAPKQDAAATPKNATQESAIPEKIEQGNTEREALPTGEGLAEALASAAAPVGEPAEAPPAQDAPLAGPAPTPIPVLPPSPLEGDLTDAYPLLLDTPRFLLHYTPGSVTAAQPEATAAKVQTALDHLERLFAHTLPGGFDVYAAGSLFSPPDQALRGRSFSTLRRLFVLQDGSGSAWDQQYIIGHELTHLYLWNAVGVPSSVMLSEGAAVYAGSKLVEGQGPIPLQHLCLAYARAGALPSVAADLSYQGHIRDLENYYTAGCFVQYLIESYGVDAFARLYPTSDYEGVYSKNLPTLADEWQTHLLAGPDDLPFDPETFVTAAEQIKNGYRELFAAFGDTPAERTRYLQLDRTRTALLEGRVE